MSIREINRNRANLWKGFYYNRARRKAVNSDKSRRGVGSFEGRGVDLKIYE
jgi:hypothetical protein